jgi:uncharacterized protein (DUF3820 family)
MKSPRYILEEVYNERIRQNEKWGEQNHPSIHPATKSGADQMKVMAILDEKGIKEVVDIEHKEGNSNWVNIAMEEFHEVACAPTEYERRNELIQLIAVCVQWVECLDRNNRCKLPEIAKFNDDTLMPYGEHKGKKMKGVPSKYLLWLLDEDLLASGPLKDYILENKATFQEVVKMTIDRENAG